MYVSEPKADIPAEFKSPLQEAVYRKLADLQIPFRRVDTGDAITMDDCIAINRALDMETVKTIFLTNRQQTACYLFVTKGDKPFVTKDFGRALGVSRVSFAPADMLLAMLGTPVGGATVLSAVSAPPEVRFVFDSEVLTLSSYGCTDGTPNGYMRITVDDVFRYLTACGRQWEVVDL